MISGQGHFNFLRLPRELRDLIYSTILLSRREAPESPADASSRWLEQNFLNRDGCGEFDRGLHGIRYEGSFAGHACASLLQCNRQISQETKEAIKFQAASSRYRIDLMFTPLDMWPTWIMLPAPLTYLESVEVDFRICDKEMYMGWSSSHHYDISMQNFLRLLSQFIVRGPRFICKACDLNAITMDAPSLCQDCQVNALHLNVLIVNFVRMRGCTKPLIPFQSLDGEDLLRNLEVLALGKLVKTLEKLANNGIVFGKIDLIRLRFDDTMYDWKVKDRDPERILEAVKKWTKYGWVSGDTLP